MSLATLFVGPGTILVDIDLPDRRGGMVLGWVFVGIGALYLGFAIVRFIAGRRSGSWPRHLRDAAIGLGLVACPLAVMNGLAPWNAAAAVWVLPAMAFLFDRRRLLSRPWNHRHYGESVLRTRFLRVVLKPGVEMPDGEIIRGQFIGQRVSELSREQLDALLYEASSDPDSVSILTGLALRCRKSRRHSDGRSDSGRRRRRNGRDGAYGTSGARSGSATMDIEEAYRVLGIVPGVGAPEIVAAHRRLMKLIHPDTGGSDYFASKLNEARDLLLGR